MEEIIAAADRIIELQEDGKWRLTVGEALQRQTLIEAQSDEAVLFYHQDFGKRHGLPSRNWITGKQVHQVLVGWAPQERCWILGLQVYHNDSTDGVKWCELVRFPVSAPSAYAAQAQRAGRALAETLLRPVHIIPAREPGAAQAAAPAAPAAPPRPQVNYTLPITLPTQALSEIPGGLRLANKGRWMLGQVGEIFFYLAMSAIFGFVSIRSLNTAYAPVHDAWLPYLGLVLMVVLVVISVWQAMRVMRAEDVAFHQERGALYYATSLGRWVRLFRRQTREPMPLSHLKAVVARNLTPKSKKPEWILFLQTEDEALVLSHFVEENEKEAPRAVQAAAAIADSLSLPMRIVLWGAGDEAPKTVKCNTCGAQLMPEQMQWGEDSQMHCTFCGAPVEPGR